MHYSIYLNTAHQIFPMEIPSPGMILISHPFLKDPSFFRSVVLLCEHQEQGSLGFVINKLFDQSLNELIAGFTGSEIPLHLGGPVQLDTVHFIHQCPDLINGSFEIIPGIYWGGPFEKALELIRSGIISLERIKFFIGYAGWDKGQLEGELQNEAWIISKADSRLIFQEKDDDIWGKSLRNLGRDFAFWANAPSDPALN